MIALSAAPEGGVNYPRNAGGYGVSESGKAERPGVGVYQVEMFDAAEQTVLTMTTGHFIGAVNLGWEYVKRDFCARFVVSRVLFDSDRVERERYDVRRPA